MAVRGAEVEPPALVIALAVRTLPRREAAEVMAEREIGIGLGGGDHVGGGQGAATIFENLQS